MIHATARRLLAVLLVLLALDAAAHPGRTAADDCHYCRTNCDRWNVEADKRHCHGGGSSPTSTTQTQTQQQQHRRVPGIHWNMAGDTGRP